MSENFENPDGTLEPIPDPIPDSQLIDMLDEFWKLINFTNRPTLEVMRELGIGHLIRAININTRSEKEPNGWNLDRLSLQAMLIRDPREYHLKAFRKKGYSRPISFG